MTNQLTVKDQIKNTLKTMEPDFRAALPAHIPVGKFLRITQTAILTNPSIMSLDRASLYTACIKAAQDGLLPDGKEAAIVPFKGKAVYMPMISGILKKLRNSGELASITAQLIYDKDFFEYYVDEDGEHLKHKPNLFADRGNLKGAYAQAKTKDGAIYIEVLSLADISAIEACSRSNTGPWKGPFRNEMIKKSTMRRLSKRLPMSTDIEQTIYRDDQFYEFDNKKVSNSESVNTPNLESSMGIPKTESVETEFVNVDDPTSSSGASEPPIDESCAGEPLDDSII